MPLSYADTLQVFAEEDITVADSSIGLTLTNVLVTPPLKRVELFVEDAQIRYRLDATAPTSSVGRILNPFDQLIIRNAGDAFGFRAIRTGSVSATIRAVYFR